MLLGLPTRGSEVDDSDPDSLNHRETTRAYYQDFRLLMQRSRAAGGPVVVHVEPDLLGYLRTSGRGSPHSIAAAVSSNDMADLEGLPNTTHGFGRALLRLRNRYGRGVMLGIHVTHWAGGVDIGSSQDPYVGGRAVGLRVGHFLCGFGTGRNLAFVDPSDRDSGWKDRYRPGGAHWWGPTNRRHTNFERYRQFADGVSTALGRRAIVWQVPIGNTRYRTLDNSEGHYQDSRAEYLLGNRAHTAQWARAGGIALLFGAGAEGNTRYNDARRDGVTNPPPTRGNRGAYARNADDGGRYLRQAITRYCRQGPVAMP